MALCVTLLLNSMELFPFFLSFWSLSLSLIITDQEKRLQNDQTNYNMNGLLYLSFRLIWEWRAPNDTYIALLPLLYNPTTPPNILFLFLLYFISKDETVSCWTSSKPTMWLPSHFYLALYSLFIFISLSTFNSIIIIISLKLVPKKLLLL